MSDSHCWEMLMDKRIALAKECQKSDCADKLEKLLLTPAPEAAMQNGNGDDSCDSKNEIRALHKDAITAGRKAYDAFHAEIEGLKAEKPKEHVWEEKIGCAALVTKDAMVAALDKFAVDSKGVIRLVEGEKERVEDANYFNCYLNGYVLFSRKVNEALELVYESRKGGQQRVWTALETAGRNVHEAEVAALKWIAGQNTLSSEGVSPQV